MRDELKRIERSAGEEIRAAKNSEELERVRIQFLGRERGALNFILRQLKDLPAKERSGIGAEANRLRGKIEKLLAKQAAKIKRTERESVLEKEWLDITRPVRKLERGHLHPLTKIIREMKAIFGTMGFESVDGPEVETEYYNFDALNIPPNHPARDMWDTFWLKPAASYQLPATSRRKPGARSEKLLLRTHTSPMQVRYMEKHNPPLRVIFPGRVYRYEATDASHEIQFYQLEGLMVDKDISIANFKYIIQQFFSRLFGQTIEVRLRPSYFPFTEPSFEVDIRKIQNSKLKIQNSGWVEIAGAGMVHPHVLKAAGLNPRQWQGFAFGMGVDRIAMMKYKIPDIRLFHSGDLRFLKQF